VSTPPKYAWRVVARDGRELSVLVTLDDEADADTVALVRKAAEANGLDLVPVYPDDLDDLDPAA
jgi:hypothetical protein